MRKERTKREGCGGRGGCKVWGNKGKKEKNKWKKEVGCAERKKRKKRVEEGNEGVRKGKNRMRQETKEEREERRRD